MNETRRNRLHRVMALAVIFAGDEPPREFRIFVAGPNTTTNSDKPYVFDDKAAAQVMAEYKAHGVDVMIDLEHLSLDDDARNYDPDARGWCKLDVRNGELWAVDVTWTPDGEARLRDKKQRYVSPVFAFAKDSRQILAIHNLAIVAMPATDHIAPLVAASQNSEQGATGMTPEQLATLADALGLGPDANVEDVIATVSAMVKKIQDAANGNDGDAEDVAEPPEGTPAAMAEKTEPVQAAAKVRVAARALAKLSGKKELGAIVLEVEAWRESHLELEKGRAKLAQDRTALEGAERRRLVGELVTLGAEIPANAWAPDATGLPDGKTPAEPWASAKIEMLRDRVAKVRASKGTPRPGRVEPPTGATGDGQGGQTISIDGSAVELSASELAACKDTGAKVEDYARNKLIRTRAQAARTA